MAPDDIPNVCKKAYSGKSVIVYAKMFLLIRTIKFYFIICITRKYFSRSIKKHASGIILS